MASLNKLPEIIASSYGSIISFMNKVIDWISKQEEFLFKDISFNMFHVLASYVLIVILFRFLQQQKLSIYEVVSYYSSPHSDYCNHP